MRDGRSARGSRVATDAQLPPFGLSPRGSDDRDAVAGGGLGKLNVGVMVCSGNCLRDSPPTPDPARQI